MASCTSSYNLTHTRVKILKKLRDQKQLSIEINFIIFHINEGEQKCGQF